MHTPDEHKDEAQDHHFDEELAPVRSAECLQLTDIYPVKLDVTADLGKKQMLVREVLELDLDSILVLDKQANEMADLSVNGIPFARGEIVVLGDTLHVRIAEILGAEEEEKL